MAKEFNNLKIKVKKPLKRSPYKECKTESVNYTLKEWEAGKLKSSSGHKVKSRQQALAIALSSSEKYCEKLKNRNDIEEENKKVEDVFDVKSNKRLSRTAVLKGIEEIKKEKNVKNQEDMKKKLITRFIRAVSNNKITSPQGIAKELIDEKIV